MMGRTIDTDKGYRMEALYIKTYQEKELLLKRIEQLEKENKKLRSENGKGI